MKTFLIRFGSIILGGLCGILAYAALPGECDEKTAKIIIDFMKTYATIATVLIGFSTGITNNFITNTNSEMMKIIRRHHFYRAIVNRFHFSTIANTIGMMLGLFSILAMEYWPAAKTSRYLLIATYFFASLGIGQFLASASFSTMIAKKTDELFGDEN
jgi:hypothetical protein